MRLVTIIAVAGALVAANSGRAQNLPPGGYKAGFPLTVEVSNTTNNAGFVHGNPVVGDLGLSPGRKSIVFATESGKLFVIYFNGAAWAVAPGFPKALPADVAGSPTIADLDGDGFNDIVVGYGSNFAPQPSPGGVVAYTRTGALLWQNVVANGMFSAVVGAPAVGDVDGDGKPEVIYGSWDQKLYVVRGADGVAKTNWPKALCDTIYSSPALADFDHDGKLEIVVGQDFHPTCSGGTAADGGRLNVFRWDGTNYPGFPKTIDQVISSSPAIGDIDGDGHLEIVVGTGTFYTGRTRKLWVFRDDGTNEPGWPKTMEATYGEVATSPALADLTGDGIPEIIVTTNNRGTAALYHVHAFNGNGTRRWVTEVRDFFGVSLSGSNPLVADVLGDASPEILVPTNGEIAVFSSTGTPLTDAGPPNGAGEFSFNAQGSLAGAAVANMECDGSPIEVIAVAGKGSTSNQDSVVSVWNPKVAASPPWGQFHEGSRHRGAFPGFPDCPSEASRFFPLTPCRVFDTRNASGAAGAPPVSGQTFRVFDVAGACGVPADAKSISGNVTIAGAAVVGGLTLYPGPGQPRPNTNSLSFSAGQTRANNIVISLIDGQLVVWNDQAGGNAAQVILDVNGYFR